MFSQQGTGWWSEAYSKPSSGRSMSGQVEIFEEPIKKRQHGNIVNYFKILVE